MILPIYLEPQQILRQKSAAVATDKIKSREFQQLLDNMIETMSAAQGIGLAAVQVGQLYRVTVIDKQICKNTPPTKIYSRGRDNKSCDAKACIFINPVIKHRSFKKNVIEEGCLSIPGIYGLVKRPAKITVEFLNRQGQAVKIKTAGLLARVLQHEIDHMNGVLFIDKVINYTQTQRLTPSYPHL